MSAQSTWRALDEAGEARTAANRPAFLPQTLAFGAQTFFWPCNLPQERYNFVKPVSKKEIPVEGFCSTHDTDLFLPIDSRPLDVADREQLFLYAYRAVVRELHTAMEAGIRTQSIYKQRVEAGIDKGDQPGAAGMLAVELMASAYSTYEYKTALDQALTERRYEVLNHEIIRLTNQAPAIAASVFFGLDTRQYDEERPRVALNIFPTAKDETLAIFSFTEKDAVAILRYIRGILESDGFYQKYLLSRTLLMHGENFVVAPSIFDSWPPQKRDAISDFSLKTVRFNSSEESEHLFLF